MKLQLLSIICYLLVIGIFLASQNSVYGQENTTAGV